MAAPRTAKIQEASEIKMVSEALLQQVFLSNESPILGKLIAPVLESVLQG